MKPLRTLSFALVLTAFFFSGSAFAKMLNGKVASVDTQTRKVTLEILDPATGSSSQSEVWLNEGAPSAQISEIKSGDTVWVEAEEDSEGNLRASQLKKA